MAAYYNEIDKHAAAWLRELIKQGLIANGDVDERSIIDVQPSDVKGYDQCHWFGGIGGWSYALRLAGVPDCYPVWTASLPCQPFSVAGKQLGKDDERHLLPHFLELVRQCKPKRIFGEQVEAAIRHGWVDDLSTEMGKKGYNTGFAVLGAHSINAPHQRQRLYWVAYGSSQGLERWDGAECADKFIIRASSLVGGLSNTESKRCRETREPIIKQTKRITLPCAVNNWDNPEWLYCQDGKHRPIKPGLKPMVDGVSERMVRGSDNSLPINAEQTQEARVMRLKGYGNAIVPQVAATFITAAMSI